MPDILSKSLPKDCVGKYCWVRLLYKLAIAMKQRHTIGPGTVRADQVVGQEAGSPVTASIYRTASDHRESNVATRETSASRLPVSIGLVSAIVVWRPAIVAAESPKRRSSGYLSAQ